MAEEPVIPSTESEPIIDGPRTYEHKQGSWLQAALYFVLALIFAFFLVLAGRWVYHKVHHNKTIAPTSSNVNPLQQSSSNSAKSQNPASNNTSPAPSSSSSNSASNSSSTSQNNSAIPNTGPGNMEAVFVSVTVLVGGLHYILTSRKTA